jgi:hypothetical protein
MLYLGDEAAFRTSTSELIPLLRFSSVCRRCTHQML